jgi:hypothetical protein
MMRLVSVACGLLLVGCAASPSISDRYSGIEPVGVWGRESYRVYDKRAENLVLVTTRHGSGFMPGSTPAALSPDSRLLPRPIFQAAADRYFAEAGRSECHVTDGYAVTAKAFEFEYACEPRVASE